MNRRIMLAVGIAAGLVVPGVVTDAAAGCNPTKDFKLAFSDEGDFFLNFPAGTNTTIGGGVLKGRFWQAGARATANEGVLCPENTYLYENGPNQLTIFGQSGGDVLGTGPCDNQGCVVGTQITLIETLSNDGTKAYYAVGKVNETVGEFRHNRGGTDWQVTEVPRPRVSSSSRTGSTINVNVNFNAPTGAHGEADGFARNSILTGYQVVSFVGAADPGRLAASWTNVGSVIPVNENSDTPAVVPDAFCNDPTKDYFFAMRPVFDDGQFLGDYVGASTRIECDAAVANPRFKMIDRTKSGRGDIRANPR